MKKVDLRTYHDSLADILCWIDGYQAANQSGIGFERLNIDGLRDLKSDLYGALYGKSPAWINSNQSDIGTVDA